MLFVLAVATSSRAQIVDSGVITGLVKDSSGAVIVDADVSIRNVATGLETRPVSNGEGFYVSPPLSSGDYELLVKAPGLQALLQHIP